MTKQHRRWQYNELQVQAYVSLPDYDRVMYQLSQKGAQPPEPVKVIVPYNYATLHAAITFLFTVLFGRQPIFPLMATRGTTTDKARYMELAMQDGFRQSSGFEVGYQWLWDQLLYGFGAGSNMYENRTGPRITLVNGQRVMGEGLMFSGNVTNNIDPYQFFPDPRVPMWRCNQFGDFVFWRSQQSKITLKDLEAKGEFKHVDAGCVRSGQMNLGPNEAGPVQDNSLRRQRIGAAGEWTPSPQDVESFQSVRQGTVRLVPKQWKLGEKDSSEIWLFTVLNGKQIVQAKPLGYSHGRHPIFVAEPTSFGYDFGSISMADMIAPFQDLISWHVNSRMENVRATVNNMFAVDPSRIELQDLRTPAPGRIIRLKRAAAGTPLDQAIQQLQVTDVTTGHMADIQVLRTLGDTTTGITDNMRGVTQQGGRRSATESRIAMQAGSGRMGQLAIRISGQGMQDLAAQQIMNIQEHMPDEMWIEVTGDEGNPMGSTLLRPDMIVGSFNYQISDGTLPFDKMALVEVWRDILLGVARDPELRARYDLDRIFEYVAQLSGAKNIGSFKRAMLALPPGPAQADPNQLASQAASGQLVPIGPAMPQPSSFMR